MADTPDYVAALQAFGKQPLEARERLVVALERTPPTRDLGVLAASVGGEATVDAQLLTALLGWLGYWSATGDKRSVEEMAHSVSGWLAASGDATGDPLALRGQLVRMLLAPSVGITGKAQQVMWGHGKVFRDAHLATEIRPLFFQDVAARPENAVLIHDLRLDYMEGGQNGSISIAMDRQQLIRLQGILQRALQKEDSLRRHSQFNYLSDQP